MIYNNLKVAYRLTPRIWPFVTHSKYGYDVN